MIVQCDSWICCSITPLPRTNVLYYRKLLQDVACIVYILLIPSWLKEQKGYFQQVKLMKTLSQGDNSVHIVKTISLISPQTIHCYRLNNMTILQVACMYNSSLTKTIFWSQSKQLQSLKLKHCGSPQNWEGSCYMYLTLQDYLCEIDKPC